jgi:subtilase family serine protease
MNKLHRFAAPLLATASIATMSHAATLQTAAPQVTQVAAAAPTAAVDFEIFLPLRDKAGLQNLLAAQQTAGSPSYHKWLTPAQFGAKFGPTATSFANVEGAATAAGLQVTAVHTRSIHVSGSAAQVNKFLQTSLNSLSYSDGHVRMQAAGPITLPAGLKQEGVVIAAFTHLPEKQVSSKVVTGPMATPNNRFGPYGGYFANDMKQAYDYPSYATKLASGANLDGTGVPVAVLMSSTALNVDLDLYFNYNHFHNSTGKTPPHISVVKVDGGAPFGPDNGASAEASLDVQQVLGGAPGAAVTIVNIPDLSDEHILDGYVTIVDSNTWALVNSSFGGCELGYTPAYNNGVDETAVLKTYDEVFAQGNTQGITFVASSGDEAGLSCPSVNYFYGAKNAVFVPSVEFPSDDPNVTAVGGGNLETTYTSGSLTSQYVAENAISNPEIPYDIYGFGANVSGGQWGAGGGQSVVFAQPTYQNWVEFYGNKVTGRIVPDVGMQVGGCPGGISKPNCPGVSPPDVSYVYTAIDGNFYGLIGTSVSSPEFVGALALVEENAGGRLGNINPFLWSQGYSQVDFGGAKAAAPAQFYHKNQTGHDGVYYHSSTTGFDYMYGNGSPDIRTLFGMTGYAPAGNPETPTNP